MHPRAKGSYKGGRAHQRGVQKFGLNKNSLSELEKDSSEDQTNVMSDLMLEAFINESEED